MQRLARAVSALAVAAAVAFSPAAVRAGTTGTIVGRIVDQNTNAPVAGARVSAVSPSQNATSDTDAAGGFRFLSLNPDTYTVTVERTGYETLSLAGVTVQADQTQTLNRALAPRLVRIGGTTARRATDLIRAGTTSDVYSVSGAYQETTQALGGPGGLTNAYAAMQSVPGANVQQGQQGWFQTLSIRGGDIDQVGYELDGIPTNRVYDNAPQTMLSNLGQQELQVYTGGTPASSDASSISGYVNQVIRTGTYPGFKTAQFGIGSPQLFNKGQVEFGGTDARRRFSYYGGVAQATQAFRYIDQYNGASDPRFFYPLVIDSNRFNVYDAAPVDNVAVFPNAFGPGQTYGIAGTNDREAVLNLHYAIPHGDLRDDVQALYVSSDIFTRYYGSLNDQGGPFSPGVQQATGSYPSPAQATWHDGFVYNGPVYGTPNAAFVQPYYFMSSPAGRALGAPLSNSAQDSNDNGVGIVKFQYQHAFDPKSYLRLYGYTMYSNWFITGLSNQNFTGYFGGELNDYELPSHTHGFNLQYANQLSDKHLLTASGSVTTAKLVRRYSYGFPGNSTGMAATTLVDSAGRCYDATGAVADCFSGANHGNLAGGGANLIPYPAVGAALAAGAQWRVTETGNNGRYNTVSPTFTAVSLSDQWRPNDKLTFNAGVRVEHYDDKLETESYDAARAFWFNAYNDQYCFRPGSSNTVNLGPGGASVANCAAIAPGYRPANLAFANGSSIGATVFQPRLGFTYAVNADTVIRGSYGVYARAVDTSWLQYDTIERNLASFIGNTFLPTGFNTPIHGLRPDVSNNYDLSLEKHVPGTQISYKLTPFYRSTRDQLQPVPIGVGGVVSGFNVGHQTSSGVELALRAGDPARNGLSAQLAYTYTHSRIRYGPLPSGLTVIDGINQYIQEYNSYTAACAAPTATNAKLCGGVYNGTPTNSSGAVTVTNPYYTAAPQPLLDPTGSYTTYDQIPQPFTGENGYETPHVASLVLSWKHDRFTVSPSLTFSSGAFYGSPLSTPGYIPSCGATAPTGTDPTAAAPYSCGGSSITSGLPYLMIPDQFTGKFDDLGAFRQPSRLTVNLQTSYDVSRRVRATLTMTGIVDRCFQRGYPWDDNNICVYSQLPSGGAGLGPSGNFVPLAATPVQLKYPYGVFSNNLNTGFLGTKIPFQATLNFSIQL
jgi:hypothetical protein